MQGSPLSNNQAVSDVAEEDTIPLPVATPLPTTPSPPVITSDQPSADPLQEKATLAQIWKEAILPYLGTRLVIFVVGLFATYYILPQITSASLRADSATKMAFPQSLWLMWARFDSGF